MQSKEEKGDEDKRRDERESSPTDSLKTVSDDDEIDYSVKPEFYDPKLDEKDEVWVQKKRSGRASDAVLSCPACFTTLCFDCQRFCETVRKKMRGVCCHNSKSTLSWHEKYITQYRAIFVQNCKIRNEPVTQPGSKRKRGRRLKEAATSITNSDNAEDIKRVCCSVCSTDVGVIDEEEVYHFLNVLPSES